MNQTMNFLGNRLGQPHVLARWFRDIQILALLMAASCGFALVLGSDYLNSYLAQALPYALSLAALSLAVEVVSGSRRLLFSVVILSGLGLLCVTAHITQKIGAEEALTQSEGFGINWLLMVAAIIAGMVSADILSRHREQRQLFLALLAGFTLLSYLVLLVMPSESGTKAWVKIAGFSFQLTELIRAAGLAAAALILSDEEHSDRFRAVELALLLGVNGVFSILISEIGTLLILTAAVVIGSILLVKDLRLPFAAVALILVAVILLTGLCQWCAGLENPSGITDIMGKLWSAKLEPRLGAVTGNSEIPYQAAQARKVLLQCSLIGPSARALGIHVPVRSSDMAVVLCAGVLGILPMLVLLSLAILLLCIPALAPGRRSRPTTRALCAVGGLSMVIQTLMAMYSGSGYFIIVGVGIPILSYGLTSMLASGILVGWVLYGSSFLAER